MSRSFIVAIACRVVPTALVTALALVTAGCENPEAKTEAKKLVDKFLTKCGETYYMYPDNLHLTIEELKGDPNISVVSTDVSETDRMNGYTWKGQVVLRCSADRVRMGKALYSWEDHCNFGLEMYKVNGTWRYKPNQFVSDILIDNYSSQKVPCEAVTQ